MTTCAAERLPRGRFACGHPAAKKLDLSTLVNEKSIENRDGILNALAPLMAKLPGDMLRGTPLQDHWCNAKALHRFGKYVISYMS